MTAGTIAFFYSLMTGFYSPVLFCIYAVCFALAGAWVLREGKKSHKEKRMRRSVRFVLCFTVGTVLTFIFAGTPSGFLKAQKQTSEYLKRTYPDQKFEDTTVYFNLKRACYAAELEYLYQGNDLTSTVFFTKEVEDGFLNDYVFWMQEKRKADLIDVFKKGSESVLVESKGLKEKTKDGVFHGSYGTVSNEMDSLFHFSATFRKEKPDREVFAKACREALVLLKENGFDFGSVTFYALDVGNVVYECTVTPETSPETVLSLVKYPQ
ncbi:MAG: hypothetical protein E7580_06460 [Ruminococcaceae bacterium]|nr:hypothetical protein [Oscillospiraceae bacterium]